MDSPRPILDRCRELGFALAGVASARPTSHEAALRRWLADGRHGQMAWLERNTDLRLDPSVFVPGARSILCVADRYADGRPDRRGRPFQGRIARYARGGDYHRLLRGRLETLRDELRADHPEESFRVCVDTAPILEREHAARAALGAIGKHTLLIEPGVGSWLLLGEIVTSLALAPTTDVGRGHSPAPTDVCGTCTRCIDACPTDAITPWSVDAARCISYLTIEHREVIDPAFHAGIGDWLFGCDVCQEVCPHSQPTRRSRRTEVHPDYEPSRHALDARELLDWTTEEWTRVIRPTAISRARLPMLRRNALIVAANTCPPAERAALLDRVRSIADDPDEDPMVRETAVVTARRLGESDPLDA